MYLRGLRNGEITVSLHSVYKLNRLLGIRNPKTKKKFKKKRKIGVRASKPNQIWHADITIVKTLDGIKQYVHLVIDNFLRKKLIDVKNKVVTLTNKGKLLADEISVEFFAEE